MKMRYVLACAAGLVPALLFLSSPAGASSGVWAQQKVTATDWVAGDLYGYSLVMTPNTVFVAAAHAMIGGNANAGAVYVYKKSDGAWDQVQKLTASDGAAGDEFGISISVSGNTLLVGSVLHGVHGAAYVFKDYGGTWTQSQEFTASDAGGFGFMVRLHQGTAVIGAPGTNDFTGNAYVFTRHNGVWSQAAELNPSDGAPGDYFGKSVGISGNTIIIGQFLPSSYTQVGSAYVFTKSGNTWIQTQKLTPSVTQPGEGFGSALAMSGSTALITAVNQQVGSFNFGAVYVFKKSGGTWSQTQILTGDDNFGPNGTGRRIAMHGDTAIVGAPVASLSGFLSFEGAAYVFTRSGNTWSLEKTLTANDASPGQFFGSAVGLSANGAIAGAIPDFDGAAGPDAAYIFGPINLGVTDSAP